jgi:hypothetical protein
MYCCASPLAVVALVVAVPWALDVVEAVADQADVDRQVAFLLQGSKGQQVLVVRLDQASWRPDSLFAGEIK